MNDLDLSALSTGPVPALAPAADVKARGEQRRNRARVALAGAAALVVVAGAGTAVALADRGKPDALQIANTPTPVAGPTEEPTDAPTQTAVPNGVFPSASELAQQLPEAWTAGPVTQPVPSDEYDRCDANVRLAQQRTGLATRDYMAAGGRHLVTLSVALYASEDEAAGAFGHELEAMRRCPTVAIDAPGKGSYNKASLLESGRTQYAVELQTHECEQDFAACDDTARLQASQVRGRFVVTVGAFPAEIATKAQLLEIAADLGDRAAASTIPPSSPSPTPSYEPVVFGPLGPLDHVEPNRIGPVVIGMTLAQAEAAAEQDLKQEGDDLGGCVYYAPRSGQPDVSFMVIDGVVSRIDVDSGTTSTNRDIGIGSTEAEVKRSYPTAVVSKHPYTDGHYLRVLDEDGKHATLFETDGHKVTSFRSGYANAVDQIEGCA
jgi:hypothetical protein